jgi:O-antigen ligase/polysaccharide polymerase Wzy-like membrane protein
MGVVDVVRRVRPLLLVPPALVVALALDQGGFDPSSWVWSGALAAWAAATAAVAWRELGLSRIAWAWLASACAVLAWVAASWLWSDRLVQTVLEARRTAVYAAVVLALVILVRRGTVGHVLVATHGAIVAVVVYALARYLTETRTLDTFEGALLVQPLGYANALAALAAIGVVLGVGLTARAPSPRGRAAAAATVPMLAAALPLTHSRGAAVALVAGAVVVVACADDAMPFVRTAVVVAPGAAVAALVAALSRLSDSGSLPHRHVGWLVAAVTIACAAGTALGASRVPPANRSRRRVPQLALAVALVIGAIAVVIRTGSTEPRASLWRVAWHQFESHVAFGSGAGTFALAWARSGLIDTRGGALDAHSLYLETLSELGLVGLALLLVFLALPLARPSRLGAGLAPVAAGAYVVFVVHAALDWDWEMPAVVIAGLCCGAAALAAGSDQSDAVSSRGRALIVVLALAFGAVSIAGARSSSEPGVMPRPLVPVVLGARVAVLPVVVPVPVLLLAGGRSRRAGRKRVAVPQVRLQRPR